MCIRDRLRAVERDSSRVWRPWSIWLRALSSWMLAEMIWFTASVMVRTDVYKRQTCKHRLTLCFRSLA